jgi:hypothetical protein
VPELARQHRRQGMSEQLADSPLTCVAEGAGDSLDELCMPPRARRASRGATRPPRRSGRAMTAADRAGHPAWNSQYDVLMR